MPVDEKEVVEHERSRCATRDAEDAHAEFQEVVVGFHRLNAIAEAMRCLRCDRR